MNDWAAHLPAGTDPADVDLTAGGTLVAVAVGHWRADPDRLVIHTAETGWVTAGELEADSARAASALAGLGLVAGDRVLCSAVASYRLVVAHVAALRLGLVVVPTNLAYRQREIAHVATDAEIAAAIVDDAERGEWVSAARPEARVLLIGEDWGPSAGAVELDQAGAADPAMIMYTSGTTGVPKGAVLSHANLLAGAAAVVLAWRWTSRDRLLLCLPLFHAHGLAVGLHGTLVSGGSAVMQAGFDVDAVLDGIAEHEATMFFGVPTMYTRLVASPRVGELAGLRLCVSGSAPLPADVWHDVARLGGQEVIERYGMTETLMNVSNPFDGARKPGSVGFPLPGVELRLAGEPGEPAEIQVRGPNVFAGYWQRPEATAESFTADGWFRTGDLGVRDADGYLSIVGRSKELILTGGFNVYPREVEDVLARHPGVAEVAVAGVPSTEWGETVAAYVVPVDRDRFEMAELEALAVAELASFKRPRQWHLVAALPRNAMGKVVRHELTAE